MKRVTSIVTVVLWAIILVACSQASRDQEHEDWVKTTRAKEMGSIEYVKDERSGLCFAKGWGGAANGGPLFSTVPCDKVEHLLVK